MPDMTDEVGLFIRTLEFIGTFAGTVSGVRLASVKRFDWFGASVIGVVTAVGGGTLRDMLMRVEPFWMTDPFYLVTCCLAILGVGIFGRRFISGQITWFIFDTISISIFMMLGLQKAIRFGYGTWWCAITLGVITAVFGGILRDISINVVPLIFRKELYALACAAGGAIYFLLPYVGVESILVRNVAGVALIFVIRALAIKYHLGVPVFTGRDSVFHHHGGERTPRSGRREGGGKNR
ncbi:MAG: trimeric intracellular cation channel family protein [Kiritimatiellae bacterium]|nr:trimeric intracellular cation channel family protein [Kiritimatiellia bacterium]